MYHDPCFKGGIERNGLGIDASGLVAMAFFTLALIVFGFMMFMVISQGIRKQVAADGAPKCPIPGCPSQMKMEKVMASPETYQ